MLERKPTDSRSPAKPMQCIVLLPHSYAGRGPAETCVQILRAFPDCNIETTLFVLRARKPVDSGIKLVEGAGPLLRRLPFRYMQAAATRQLYRKFARAIDKALPGTIVWFWPDSPISLVKRAKERGLTTVRELINSPVAHAKPILDKAYRNIGLEPGHGITDSSVSSENEELFLYDYLFASNPEVETALVALGLPVSRILSTSFGWDRSRFSSSFSDQTSAEDDRLFRVCFVGLMNVRKGLPVLIQAWQMAGISGELLLAGSIEPALQPMVDAAITQGSVKHVGHVSDVASLYRKCDAFVFPTLEEGGPQVTYEAASCGLPVITTPMGAARLVEDGTTGLVVPAGNVQALADAMRRLEADRKLSIKYGLAARQAAETFEYGNVGRERAELLRRAIS